MLKLNKNDVFIENRPSQMIVKNCKYISDIAHTQRRTDILRHDNLGITL